MSSKFKENLLQLIQEEITDAELSDNKKRVSDLRKLSSSLSNGTLLTLREAQTYLSLYGLPVKSRKTFYRLIEVVYSIPYEDMNPGGQRRRRVFDMDVLELFVQHREAFRNSPQEIEFLESLDAVARRTESLRLGREKLCALLEQLDNQT